MNIFSGTSLLVFIAVNLLVARALGVPTVHLSAPSAVHVGQQWIVSIQVDGVNSIDPVLGAEEFFAFGFNVGYPYTLLSFSAYAIDPTFNDDTALMGGPFAGSRFPGLTGDNIPVGTLSFMALSPGTAIISVGDQGDRPDVTGLFTSHDRYPILAYADVAIAGVPDEGATSLLFLIGMIGIYCMKARLRGRPQARLSSPRPRGH